MIGTAIMLTVGCIFIGTLALLLIIKVLTGGPEESDGREDPPDHH